MSAQNLASIATLIFGTLLLAAPAYAMRGDQTNLSIIRHQEPTPVIRLIRVQGALSCNYAGGTNTGQGCALKIQESKTGRVFNLVSASSAMRLFLDGSRDVTVEGTMANADTIQVRKIGPNRL